MTDPALPAVDPGPLQVLTGRLGERAASFREQLISTWRTEMDMRLSELDTATATGDTDAVARIAHTVKSGSASLGAMRVAALCERVETAIRAGQPCDLPATRDAIRAEAAAADAAFAELPPA